MKSVYRNLLIALGVFLALFVLLVLVAAGYELAATLLGFVYCCIILFLFLRWLFRQYRSMVNLKNEKAKTELLHLKSQVNPHFFFNMLNNLYGLVRQDATQAQELILKLSDLMRYSIYEGQKEEVTLEEEVAYLKNYIALHKMRYHKQIAIRMNMHLQNKGYKVMPLLFIILLENAFKHGVENLRENAFVSIHMANGANEIHFEVINNYDASAISETEGIGLKNLKRRLELVYPNKHSLSFSDTDNTYKAKLVLQL